MFRMFREKYFLSLILEMRQQLGVCKVVGKELVNKAKLFITKLVPTLRRDEDNGDCRAKTRRAKGCLHIKSALTYCESTVKHSIWETQGFMTLSLDIGEGIDCEARQLWENLLSRGLSSIFLRWVTCMYVQQLYGWGYL